MTLETLKTEYKKSITLKGKDLRQLTEEIDQATTLNDFIDVVSAWSSEVPTIGAANVILKRVIDTCDQ